MNRIELLDYIETDNFKATVGHVEWVKIKSAIQTLYDNAVDAEVSNRGYAVCHKSISEKIGKMAFILKCAVETEEVHYIEQDNMAGWILEAKDILIDTKKTLAVSC